MPWEGAEAFAFNIFPPVKSTLVAKYEKIHSLTIPPLYRDLLVMFNGLYAFDMSLFGIPASMLGNPPVLDRSFQQCHDIGSANRTWIHDYDVDSSLFHFGGRAYSYEANAGYFLDSKGWIYSYLEDGSRVGRWKAIDSFLKAELAAAEELVREGFPSDWCG